MANGNSSSGSGSGFLIIILGVIVLGGVGLYYISKRQSRASPSDFELGVSKDNEGRIQVTGTNLDIGGIAFDTDKPIYATEFYGEKPGIPIIGGGEHLWHVPAGTCKCNDYRCCYETVYQPARGGPITKRACGEILYGDAVAACEQAVQRVENEIFSRRSRMI